MYRLCHLPPIEPVDQLELDKVKNHSSRLHPQLDSRSNTEGTDRDIITVLSHTAVQLTGSVSDAPPAAGCGAK
jgi:hypothetical protein